MTKILVVCGAGVATAAVVARKLRSYLAGEGITASVRQGKIMDLLSADIDADLIISTVPLPDDLGLPVLDGVPLLTGGAAADEALSTVRDSIARAA